MLRGVAPSPSDRKRKARPDKCPHTLHPTGLYRKKRRDCSGTSSDRRAGVGHDRPCAAKDLPRSTGGDPRLICDQAGPGARAPHLRTPRRHSLSAWAGRGPPDSTRHFAAPRRADSRNGLSSSRSAPFFWIASYHDALGPC